MKPLNPRAEGFPDRLVESLELQWSDLEGLLRQKPYLPSTIKAISDHFMVRKGEATPWHLDGVFEAYLAYFHSLNTVRMTSVLRHLKQRLPNLSANTAIDFGSGLGATELAWSDMFPERKLEWQFVEANPTVSVWHEKLRRSELNLSDEALWHKSIEAAVKADIFFSSYGLNELDELPKAAIGANIVVLLEPSDRYHSRQLMAWRQKLIEQGFEIVAPCTHQQGCPLLLNSKQDFCHDRIPLIKPSWFQKIEDQLPIKNDTITFSYLIATKDRPEEFGSPNVARVLGDTLREKGKTKQMVCRSEQREFLSWLKRHGEAQFLPHGGLVEIPQQAEIKGSEVRVGGITINEVES